MQEYRLRQIDDQFIKGSVKLHEISDDRKVKSLECLTENWEVVVWIQKSHKSNQLNNETLLLHRTMWSFTAGLNDLHSFVDVALTTSAEDDMCTKIISDLRTIGNAVGPLIYDLPKSSGVHVSQYVCVWAVMCVHVSQYVCVWAVMCVYMCHNMCVYRP